jgi:hypothetical protein
MTRDLHFHFYSVQRARSAVAHAFKAKRRDPRSHFPSQQSSAVRASNSLQSSAPVLHLYFPLVHGPVICTSTSTQLSAPECGCTSLKSKAPRSAVADPFTTVSLDIKAPGSAVADPFTTKRREPRIQFPSHQGATICSRITPQTKAPGSGDADLGDLFIVRFPGIAVGLGAACGSRFYPRGTAKGERIRLKKLAIRLMGCYGIGQGGVC